MRGVASTGTDPERIGMAVSSSLTTSIAEPRSPISTVTGAHTTAPAAQTGNIADPCRLA